MVQQLITLPLGGAERTLLFGVNGYFEYIAEATKMDPFEWLKKFDEHVNDVQAGEGKGVMVFMEDTAVMVYAGLNSFLDSKDQANVPFEKVKKWCNGLSNEMTVEIFKTAFGTISAASPDKPGELQPNQENGEQKVTA